MASARFRCRRRAVLFARRRGDTETGRAAHREHDEEGEMAGEHLPARIDARADRLRDAEDRPAGQRAPQAAEPADDDRLEREDQPRRPDRRIEIGAHPRNTPAIATTASATPIATAKDACVDAHQLRAVGIVGGGAEGAAERVR
jgi:hypothetical protein